MKTDEDKYKGNLETDLSQTLETGVDIATPSKDPKRTARAILQCFKTKNMNILELLKKATTKMSKRHYS